MTTPTINLGRSFDMFKLNEKLLDAKPNIFGISIRMAVSEGNLPGAVQMIKDQVKDGHTESVELTIGLSALKLVYKLFL